MMRRKMEDIKVQLAKILAMKSELLQVEKDKLDLQRIKIIRDTTEEKKEEIKIMKMMNIRRLILEEEEE